jgi:apolipoprotein N-acyltransferase
MIFPPQWSTLKVQIVSRFKFNWRFDMNDKQVTYPVQDRWTYLWLLIGTLLGFAWRIPLVWWLSPVFMLRFMRTQRIGRGFLLIWLASFLTTLPPMYGIMNSMMPSPLPVFLVTTAVTTLIAGAMPFLADRLLAPRLKGFTATLIFPLAVVVIDYISAKANPLGSIGAQAYFQYGNLALMQLLSITGMWGIVFLVNWLGPVVNYAWERGFVWKSIGRNIVVYTVIMLAVLLYGGARLAYAPQASSTVKVHGITAVDMRQNWSALNQLAEKEGWEVMRQKAAEYHDLYFEATVREARAGAQIVHWPEMAVMVPGEDEPAFIARAQQIAREEGIYLAMGIGMKYKDGRPWENKLTIIDPAGDVVLEHHKYSLVAEEGTKGGDGILRTVTTPFGTLSGIVCNDTNHEEMVAQAGRNGTDILFSPSLEYRQIDPLHAHMATYRAIENGVTLVRQADNGLSIVVDPYGRVSATMDHFNNSKRVMAANVPILSTFTIYPYIGDLFAWLAMAGLTALIVVAIVQRRRERRAVTPAAPAYGG